jgi:hypothetical protein
LPGEGGGEAMNPYVFQRGETITLSLDVLSGDPGTVSAIVAGMKLAQPGGQFPSQAGVVTSFTPTFVAAAGEIPAHWLLTINAAVSAGLAVGNYVADAKITISGGVIITESVQIQIRDSVSG